MPGRLCPDPSARSSLRAAEGGGLCYNSGVGKLFLVATPIGNLEDITLRALRVLREVRLIAAEDTRHTRKLLRHHGIQTPLISYHEHSKEARLEALLRALEEGDLALVSDAGTPALSDPGYELVQAALQAGHAVEPIPGPSAPVAALVASGFATDQFVFLGYLPRRKAERQRLLKELASERRTAVCFEVPHRLHATLEDMLAVWGGERRVAICRELTKLHEEILRGPLSEVGAQVRAREPRGEYTIVIEGTQGEPRWTEAEVRAALAERLEAGLSPSQAARELASISGWTRREIYRLSLEEP